MKKFILLIGLFLFAFMLGCTSSQEEETETSIPVQVFTIRPDSISRYIEVTGNLEAAQDAQIFAKVSENIDRIVKQTGSRVKQNDIIAVQYNRIWQQGLKQAEANLESVRARHQQVEQEYKRYQRLFQQKAVSEQQWEQVKSSWQEVQAGLNRAEAAYQQAKEQLENTYIRAPFDGVVGSLYFDEDEMVPQGQPITKIVNTNLMKAKLNIPDTYIKNVKIGQMVKATFPPLPDESFTGKIHRIDPAIDPLSRTFQAIALFNNQNQKMSSGMYGLFKIEIDRHVGTFVVPDNSIIRRTDVEIVKNTGETFTKKRHFAFVVKNDTARLVQVETGLETSGRVEITRGLQENDQIIVRGQKIVKDGQKVRVVRE